jgi:hypothetical protein
MGRTLMGYCTVILIQNDALDQIKSHPEQFTDTIVRMVGSHGEGEAPVGNHGNAFRMMRPFHVSETHTYIAHGGTMVDMEREDQVTRIAQNAPKVAMHMYHRASRAFREFKGFVGRYVTEDVKTKEE